MLCRASLAAAFAAGFALSGPVLAASHTVSIEGMKYVPERLEIEAGDTVTWTNKDLVPHTVTASAAKVESGSIAPNASWQWKASRKGEIDYTCRFHPVMHGTLVVQ